MRQEIQIRWKLRIWLLKKLKVFHTIKPMAVADDFIGCSHFCFGFACLFFQNFHKKIDIVHAMAIYFGGYRLDEKMKLDKYEQSIEDYILEYKRVSAKKEDKIKNILKKSTEKKSDANMD